MDQLRSMKIFRAVAREGGFSAAARQLGVSAPLVTRAIADLEDHLGIVLFNRTTRSVSLTDHGTEYLDNVGQILELVAATEQDASKTAATVNGTLNITAPVVYGRLHIMPIVAKLTARYPDLDVRLLLIDRNVHLEEEAIDIAVRIGVLANTALKAVRIDQVRRIFVGSPAYFKHRDIPRSPSDIDHHDNILISSVDASPVFRFEGSRKIQKRIKPKLTVNSNDAAIAAAKMGIGIADPLDYQAAEALGNGELLQVLEDFSPSPIPVHLLFSKSRANTPAVRAFIDLACSRTELCRD